jgi:hypothetical protein
MATCEITQCRELRSRPFLAKRSLLCPTLACTDNNPFGAQASANGLSASVGLSTAADHRIGAPEAEAKLSLDAVCVETAPGVVEGRGDAAGNGNGNGNPPPRLGLGKVASASLLAVSCMLRPHPLFHALHAHASPALQVEIALPAAACPGPASSVC